MRLVVNPKYDVGVIQESSRKFAPEFSELFCRCGIGIGRVADDLLGTINEIPLEQKFYLHCQMLVDSMGRYPHFVSKACNIQAVQRAYLYRM